MYKFIQSKNVNEKHHSTGVLRIDKIKLIDGEKNLSQKLNRFKELWILKNPSDWQWEIVVVSKVKR